MSEIYIIFTSVLENLEEFSFSVFSNMSKYIAFLGNYGIIKIIFLTTKANRSLRYWKLDLICSDLLSTFMFLSFTLKQYVLLLVLFADFIICSQC